MQRTEINLVQHAKNNGILASYELPKAHERNEDGRHTDDFIQTLLLPTDLERKLNAIISKSRTWVQETGISVLQVAFGFLEWSDDGQTESSFAPLILLQVDLNRIRTPRGPKYSIEGTGEESELNTVLAEKMRIDFAVEMPTFDGSSIESYLTGVAKVLPKRKNWRIRRQVAIGVFPSARMAMYHDLDPKQPAFPQNDIVQSLLAGSETAGALPFADDYDVDNPDIEKKVPVLVMDADSSQFSTLVDISDGKNLAVEGPPGTGKSQTIVNAIAAALGDGKKILFVAEKLAALNVVKARLEAVGLGEFLLPLQAEKSSREQVIESIRTRLDMRETRAPRDYDEKLKEFRRTRQHIADYIELVKTEFGDSGLTVHAILGKSIATSSRLAATSTEVLQQCDLRQDMLTAAGLSFLMQLGTAIENAHVQTLSERQSWARTQLLHADRFTIEEACSLAKRASDEVATLAQARERLEDWGIDKDHPLNELKPLKAQLDSCGDHLSNHSIAFLIALLLEGKADGFASFLDRCTDLQTTAGRLSAVLSSELDEGSLDKLRKIDEVCRRAALSTVHSESLVADLQTKKRTAGAAQAISAALTPLIAARQAATAWLFDDLGKAYRLCRAAGRDALNLRTARLADEAAVFDLSKLCEEGSQLQLLRDKISSEISASVDIPLQSLVQCVDVMRTAGPFSFLSSSHRNARRLFKSISKAGKSSRTGAIQSLDELIAYRRRLERFAEAAEASGVFGRYYRGIDTKYEPFDRLAKYLTAVIEHFGSPEHRNLRTFLWHAEAHELELLPALPITGTPLTFVSLNDRLDDAVAQVKLLEAAIEDLRDVVGVLRNTDIEPVAIQSTRRELESFLSTREEIDRHTIASELLADRFEGHRTRVHEFKGVADWAQSTGALAALTRHALSRGEPKMIARSISEVLVAEERLSNALDQLSEIAKIDVARFLEGRPLREAVSALAEAARDSDGLFAHSALATALQDAAPFGIMPLIESRLSAGSLIGLGGQFEAVAVRQLARAVYAQLGTKLTRHRGSKLDELRATLAEKDKDIIQLSRRQLRNQLRSQARPPSGNGMGKKSSWTDMALIENEISKKQRYISVRDLTQRAGNALIELKPCWMMSPLAVAQYVPKSSIKFDLCIIDEASQMPPESAIGALLRCEQAVVVGDTNQLPPSSFFKSLIDEEDADEDETVLNESVLEMANGAFRPARRLRWHYRSRHSGLIKFSNRLIYDDDLIVFPSATESLTRMGVEFRSVKGRYKSGTNPVEARAIVEATIDFMRTDPDRSLGLVTLNQKQRDLILEEFEYAIAADRSVQKYIDTWKERNDGLEEFFIKNLENVQGDERDVIFIGTVYGAEEPGARVMQRFGPINGLAGKRRLNVLFTRAKQKVITFSSMTGADIDATEHSNPGAYMLKRWLEYAASGVLDAGEETDREPDSDFEVFVIDQIRAMGCRPVPQVGVAGYFIDIGVRHPEWPHGYILGVECDGASYHSAKSARDRDRLRQEILEHLGWRLHRIWSTDWFNNPGQEAARLRKVIAERLVELKAREHEYVRSPITLPQPTQDEVLPVRDESEVSADEPLPSATKLVAPSKREHRVEIGDTIRIRYLTEDKRILNVTISESRSDPSCGIIHYKTPAASALLGAEEGDEVEVLVGSYIRPALIESIVKGLREGIAAS